MVDESFTYLDTYLFCVELQHQIFILYFDMAISHASRFWWVKSFAQPKIPSAF